MPDSYPRFAAFSAYTAILVALGYILRVLHVDYRVMRTIVKRTVDTRDAHMQRQAERLEAARDALVTAKRELEQERAELAKAKGLSA